MVVASTVCAGSPIPFDPTEVDRKLAAEHTLSGLAETANHVVFDLFDHCAVVVRFFVVEKGAGPRRVKTSGDRRLVPNRVARRPEGSPPLGDGSFSDENGTAPAISKTNGSGDAADNGDGTWS